MFSSLLVDCWGRIRRWWPCWRRSVTGVTFKVFTSLCLLSPSLPSYPAPPPLLFLPLTLSAPAGGLTVSSHLVLPLLPLPCPTVVARHSPSETISKPPSRWFLLWVGWSMVSLHDNRSTTETLNYQLTSLVCFCCLSHANFDSSGALKEIATWSDFHLWIPWLLGASSSRCCNCSLKTLKI